MTEAIAKAVDEIAREQPHRRRARVPAGRARDPRGGRGAAQARPEGAREILPLFSRLSAEEQDRVFERAGQRRVVLATNVAETSLTVPGIHYVIDTGLARVKRYSPRQKIDQLRIEPISQAAARQRAGRCGRVASGIAIRLYAEEDFDARPEFTTPEILRTSLASVILRMAALELGPIAEFPFVEPPTPRQIEDGYQRAVRAGRDRRRSASSRRIGHELARLPVDPRIGRMLVAAREFHCALRDGDPRRRALDPGPARPPAGHARGVRPRARGVPRRRARTSSSCMNLWKFFDEEFVHKKSNRKLYETCREHFLSYVRMREWRDLAGQLREMACELKIRENATPATYEQVHRALLTGLIGNVGLKAQRRRPLQRARAACSSPSGRARG